MIKNPFIGIAGNIGVGKTTFTSFLAKELNLKDIYESVSDNPYLSDFYGDMHRWSFNLQVYFLHHRFASIIDIENSHKGFVQDRTIYEDVEIFSKNLHDMGYLDDRDWKTYSDLFLNMTKFLKSPDIIIYLRADLDVLLERINNRNRDYEATIDPEYLKRLNLMYDEWIENITWTKVLIIDTNTFNIFEDKDTLESIFKDIKEKLK
ncbi:MAG: deoxynucleoside kinase [Candidatus Marinimicrobia bacterium]|nr:deoxynucleoside kinase [Candidatus Neomarinimicrobiota bacterium]|tara:strand:+ start:73 stop:690 length:618 start_codon:yes stop_codon:yes gene_type:complete